jgi:hypothetical protein
MINIGQEQQRATGFPRANVSRGVLVPRFVCVNSKNGERDGEFLWNDRHSWVSR